MGPDSTVSFTLVLLFDFSQRANLLSICFIIPTQFYDTGLLLISKRTRLAEVTRVSLTPTSFSTSCSSVSRQSSSTEVHWFSIELYLFGHVTLACIHRSFYGFLLTYSEEQQDLQRASPHPISGKVELNYTQNKSISNVKVVVAPVQMLVHPSIVVLLWLVRDIIISHWIAAILIIFLPSCQSSITWAGKQNILNCLE